MPAKAGFQKTALKFASMEEVTPGENTSVVSHISEGPALRQTRQSKNLAYSKNTGLILFSVNIYSMPTAVLNKGRGCISFHLLLKQYV